MNQPILPLNVAEPIFWWRCLPDAPTERLLKVYHRDRAHRMASINIPPFVNSDRVVVTSRTKFVRSWENA